MWQSIFSFVGTYSQSIVTLIVGVFAVGLYIRQKYDEKRKAAASIIQEIRYAEHKIKDFKEFGQYSLAEKLLPTNSWNKNMHLFVKDLNETDLDLTSTFYAKAAYLDIVVNKISDKKNDLIVPIAPAGGNVPSAPPATANIQNFDFLSNKILKDVSDKIDFIYNTPAIDKLRAISVSKKWLIF